jgi:hypothetical protein
MLEILDAAAYSSNRSSKANGLCCAVPAIFGANVAEMSADFNPFGYRSSNPTTPATQSVSVATHSGSGDHPLSCLRSARKAGGPAVGQVVHPLPGLGDGAVSKASRRDGFIGVL